MKTVIFENRMSASSWIALMLGFVAAGAVVIIGGRNVAMGMALVSGAALATVIAIVAAVAFVGRRQLAVLTLEDGMLEAEHFSLLGKGRRVSFPAVEASKWRWKARTPRGVRYATLAFTYGGVEYTMPFTRAKVKDLDAFREIAPFLLWA
jgi:hypothetical protein